MWWGFLGVAFLLLGCTPTVHTMSSEGALHAAVISGNLARIDELIAAGANLNAIDEDGNTALLIAVIRLYRGGPDNLELANHLLNLGADPNVQNRWGETPLIQAVRSGQWALIEPLLAAGADQTVTTVKGETALSLAEYYHYREVVWLLLKSQIEWLVAHPPVDLAELKFLLARAKSHDEELFRALLITILDRIDIRLLEELLLADAIDPNQILLIFPDDGVLKLLDYFIGKFGFPSVAGVMRIDQEKILEMIKLLLLAGADPEPAPFVHQEVAIKLILAPARWARYYVDAPGQDEAKGVADEVVDEIAAAESFMAAQAAFQARKRLMTVERIELETVASEDRPV